MNKYFYIILVFLILSNCSLNKIEINHGTPFLELKEKILIINKTNKNDILKELGAPSTTSFFDKDLWIYIEKKSTNSSLIKFASKKNIKSNVLVLEIDKKGLLTKKDLYTLDDINELKFSENTTMSSKKDSFVYGFVSSVRQKIDAPKRRKKVKKQ
jgi:outer membrane protein assembly factor BamE (lipoprotein component of BamABCDE complex)|tara:strand:- start:35 stop:502 length:468 start_codon:yes stop_codon:yes gene_type:complete